MVARRRRDVTGKFGYRRGRRIISTLDLKRKLNAVEQSLAEEKGKLDEWLARTAAKNSVISFSTKPI